MFIQIKLQVGKRPKRTVQGWGEMKEEELQIKIFIMESNWDKCTQFLFHQPNAQYIYILKAYLRHVSVHVYPLQADQNASFLKLLPMIAVIRAHKHTYVRTYVHVHTYVRAYIF